MNSVTTRPGPITSYQELLDERSRLEELIRLQKNILRVDLEEIKETAQQEVKPIADVTQIVRKFTTRETRNDALLMASLDLLSDLMLRKVFARTPLLFQVLIHALVKNYTSHALFNFFKQVAENREAQQLREQQSQYVEAQRNKYNYRMLPENP